MPQEFVENLPQNQKKKNAASVKIEEDGHYWAASGVEESSLPWLESDVLEREGSQS